MSNRSYALGSLTAILPTLRSTPITAKQTLSDAILSWRKGLSFRQFRATGCLEDL